MMTTDPRYLFRAVQREDLAGLLRLAQASAIGISSLPPDREALRQKIEHSLKSMASADDASGEESYLFVLEDRARGSELIGTSGIVASAGFHDRFFSYRSEYIVQVSKALGVRNRIHTLHLCHDLTGVTLLTGFHIAAAYAGTLAPQLLSRARLMFIAQFPERFSERIASENPGPADDNGQCPFWDGVGRRFFNLDYPTAEALTSGGALIAELVPQSPIYVPLLDAQAQWALGQLHEVAELPFEILLDEGFDTDTYVNIYDGGPTVEGRLPLLKTVSRMQAPPGGGGRWRLLCNSQCGGFRATLGEAGSEASGLLGLKPGQRPASAALDLDLPLAPPDTLGGQP